MKIRLVRAIGWILFMLTIGLGDYLLLCLFKGHKIAGIPIVSNTPINIILAVIVVTFIAAVYLMDYRRDDDFLERFPD